MDDFISIKTKKGFRVKLWRGERMCLVAFDVAVPEDDFVGFAIERKGPGEADFTPLMNRLAFSYERPLGEAVTGARIYDSREAPFQKFRWIDFARNPRNGIYTYRATKMHMPQDGILKKGTAIDLSITLSQQTYDGFLDVRFTRGFASSQAFRERLLKDAPPNADLNALGRRVIPASADEGLGFKKMAGGNYAWLGFEAYELLFGMLDEAVADPSISLDVMAYDINEPDIVDRLAKLGRRLRILIDDSKGKDKQGAPIGHGTPESAESRVASRLALKADVRRTHFSGLQHHKVLIARRNGVAFKVLAGSTNFSFRGIYIQANNALVFRDAGVAALYAQVFDAAFADPAGFAATDLASKWHVLHSTNGISAQFCFSPHKAPELSLAPLAGAIEQAGSSVLYSVAFLNQIKSGPTKEAFDRLLAKPLFSYGISNEKGGMTVKKPDGSIGLVDFAYLADNAPEPFKSEWAGGAGINVHHKFVVVDFNAPNARVFTGSSNLAPSGEKGNGDHLIMIQDRKVAIAYAIEALRIFDHLHFRSRMQDVDKKKTAKSKSAGLTLQKPTMITGKPAWFAPYYLENSQKLRDRQLFSR